MTVRKTLRLLALILILAFAAQMCPALAAEDGYAGSYTYNYDYWVDIRESPDAYRVSKVLDSAFLKLDTPMKKPQSLFVRGNDIYVCDTGNNRILQIRRDGESFRVERVIDEIKGAEVSTFDTPNDVFVDENGNIYVCDTNHNRVVMADRELNYIQSFLKPEDSTYDPNLSFLPNKLVVDNTGRPFVLATNINKGLIKYEANGAFTGYIGANPVKYTLYDYLWKNFLSTKAQREQQEAFVPTEYSNIYMDHEGFIYATNMVFSEYDLLYDNAKPIRRLNGVGNDILIKNDRYAPIGELIWMEQSERNGPSKMVDITVLDNDVYIAFDRTRGRLFGYDSQGIMLWAFGTTGNSDGAFIAPISIEHMGYDLFCLDQNENSITVFTPTEYGMLIYNALEQYDRGEYYDSADTWMKVLKFNANYTLAFVGVGRALVQQERYKEAMDYFKRAYNRVNYGKAFKYYRKVWVEENIGWLATVLAAFVVILLIRGRIRKMKQEVEEYERTLVRK